MHVVPETPDRPKTITTAAEWRMGPPPARPKIAAANASEIKAPARRIAKHRAGKSKAEKQAAAKQAADKPRPSKTGRTGDANATGTNVAATKVVGLSLLGIKLGDTDARSDTARPRDRADEKRTGGQARDPHPRQARWGEQARQQPRRRENRDIGPARDR